MRAVQKISRMSTNLPKGNIGRRNFLCRSAVAAAGVICAGSAASPVAAEAVHRAALGFIGKYSGNFFFLTRDTDRRGVTRVVAEVRDLARLGEAFHGVAQHGIERLHVAGTLATFQIGGHTFEVEGLCPDDFAARNFGAAGVATLHG